MKPVIIYGNSTLAKQVYFESKKSASDFNVAAFCAGDNFLNDETFFCELPLIAESTVVQRFPPDKFDMLSCVDAPSRLRNRLKVYDKLKGLGYTLRNYVSPDATVSEGVKMGENNIIYAFAQIFIDTELGHSNTIKSNVIIAHDVIVGNGSNVGEAAVVGGNVRIGDSCWIGMNSTVNNRLTIADDTLVASGAVVMSNTNQGTSYVGNPAKAFFSHKETGVILDFERWNK